MTESKFVLVVDDEPMIRESIAAYLEKQGYAVLTAEDGTEALALFRKNPVIFVILDLMLPGLSGEDICRTIRRESRVPVLMLTAKTAEESVIEGLAIGADDYVTKPFSVRQLYARMEAILRRAGDDLKPLSEKLSWNRDDLQIDFSCNEVRKQGETVKLTPIEWRILAALVKYPKRIFPREDLIALAIGEDFDGFDRAIDTHIKNLRKKLETDPKDPVYIQTVRGIGYRFGGG